MFARIPLLYELLVIDKVYILNPKGGQYDVRELQKRQHNSFFTKIIQSNK
uniref:Uncharacterized protein n=1 Tax=viral metagenome TaxID=1070528 RepID=A0A6C0ISZ4_9ZZZZ